jgi:DNA-binding CsgD family transcriptional regulator
MALAEFDSLIAMIYGAVGRPEVWGEALASIGEIMNAERTLFYIQDLKANCLLFSAVHNIDPAFVAIFEKKYLNDPSTFTTLLPSVGSVGTSREPKYTVPREEMPIYHEIMAPLHVYYGSGALVLREDTAVGAFAAMRSREPGPFTEDEDDVLVRLTPHLSRAAQLHYRFLATELERAAAASVLDRVAHATLICDAEARVLIANAAARGLFDGKRGLRLVGGYLGASTASQSNRLLAAIRAVGQRERETAGLVLERGEDVFRVHLSRVSPDLRVDLPQRPDLVLISFSDPAADLTASTKVLGEMLQLTETEARVALGLARGKTLETIAEESRVSINTIKTHLASAFGKTGTSRQPDLVRLVLRTIGPFGLG